MATAEGTGETNSGLSGSGSDVFFDNICQPCKTDGKILEAEGRCEDCDEYLCKRCFHGHTLPTVTRNHVLIRKDQANANTIPRKKDQCTQKCLQHDDEIIKYYCPTHSFLGCSACIIMNHKSCDDMVYIPDAAKDILNSKEYRAYTTDKAAIESKSKAILSDTKEKIYTVNRQQVSAVEKIRAFKKEAIELFDKAEKELIEDSEKRKEAELSKQKTIEDKTDAIEKDMSALISQVQNFESKNQFCNMYIALIRAKPVLKTAGDKLGAIDERNIPHKIIHFLPNYSMADVQRGSNCLGQINEDGIKQVKHEKDIDVKTQSDTETCWISGSALLPNNNLVIADCNNGNIKVIDTSQNKVVEEFKFPSKPWDVTVTGSTEVAVTLYSSTIAFVDTSEKLKIKREIDVDGICRGIACTRNGTLVVTFDVPPKVVFMDMQGVVLKDVTTDKKGQPFFREPLYVVATTTDSMNESVYISDAQSSKVLCMKSNGELLSTYTDTDLTSPTGMVLDNQGKLYICDWKQHNVHQITLGCKKERLLMTSADVEMPYVISYCDFNDTFCIGMRDNNILKVFKVV